MKRSGAMHRFFFYYIILYRRREKCLQKGHKVKKRLSSGKMPKFPSFYIDKKIFSLLKLYEMTKDSGQMNFHALLYTI